MEEVQPAYVVQVPANIRKLILWRYIYATWLCACLEYVLLGLFLVVVHFEMGNTSDWIKQVFTNTLCSIYTWTLMQGLHVGVGIYGLLLFKMHNKRPIYYATRMERIIRELPRKLTILAVLLYVGFYSGFFYSRFAEDLKFISLYYGLFCGLHYFMRVHRRRHVFPKLPIARFGLRISVKWICWNSALLALRETFLPALFFCVCYFFFTTFLNKPQTWIYTWSAGVLITAKLHIVRQIYDVVLNLKLPLVIEKGLHPNGSQSQNICLRTMIWELLKQWICDPFNENPQCGIEETQLRLTLSEALSTKFLYGFQLQAAKDFYDIVSCYDSPKCREIFQLNRCMKAPWSELRDVILEMLDEFIKNMEACCPQPSMSKQQKSLGEMLRHSERQARLYLGMRPLVPPFPKFTLTKHYPGQEHRCLNMKNPQPYPSDLWAFLREMVSWMNNAAKIILENYVCSSRRLEQLFKSNVCSRANHELRCAQPLILIIQGLATVCERSLTEDKYGVVQSDLKRIFEILINVEQQLINAHELTYPTLQTRLPATLDKSYHLLRVSTGRSLDGMLEAFGPYLEHISDKTLLDKLRERLKNHRSV
ncbi:nucleoporin Ndc1 [Scaptodrosophila lebanonensis]|uniref:Nucleoporin Ndc1 n=1 Tax=Drosophila lebanonensis TaxID=7225 RepID=A0A6J2TDI1_DROLE|nr:nucleoporin Ndc1 [Scaptodrosophila lebanonensis]